MDPLGMFAETLGCFQGACYVTEDGSPGFGFVLMICLYLLWVGAKITAGLVADTGVGTLAHKAFGKRYRLALKLVLFFVWFVVAFGYSVPAIGPVELVITWMTLVPLHAALLMAGLAVMCVYAWFVMETVRHPDEFRPETFYGRLGLVAVVMLILLGWAELWTRFPQVRQNPVALAPQWMQEAMGIWMLEWPIKALWWVISNAASINVIIVFGAVSLLYVLLPSSTGRPVAGRLVPVLVTQATTLVLGSVTVVVLGALAFAALVLALTAVLLYGIYMAMLVAASFFMIGLMFN